MVSSPHTAEPGVERKSSFFRQSGWLMFANIAAGGLMWAVHFLSKRIPEAEYGVVGTLFALTMVVPTLPLQMVFAQQTAKALAFGRRAQLRRMVRRSLLALTLVWLVWAGVMAVFHRSLIAAWQITNPLAFWTTLVAVLLSILLPVLGGLLQGRQAFFPMGFSQILSAVGRLGGAVFIVMVLGGHAAGIMTAVVLGLVLATGYAAYATRDLWSGPGEPFRSRELLGQVVPLMLGFGACQFLFTADTMFVKAWFPGEQVAYYVAAGTLSRALMWLVLPLAAVMFPKIVHSTARSQKTDLLALTLLGTALLAVCGALGLWWLGPYVVRLVYTPAYVEQAVRLLPWYAGAIVPLALANVLINNLLAKGDFRPVPALVLLAVGFAIALNLAHASLVQVLQVMAACNTLFLLLCVFFTWVWKPSSRSSADPSPSSVHR
jgi:O-antigen/teichoic acid export membrane protein